MELNQLDMNLKENRKTLLDLYYPSRNPNKSSLLTIYINDEIQNQISNKIPIV